MVRVVIALMYGQTLATHMSPRCLQAVYSQSVYSIGTLAGASQWENSVTEYPGPQGRGFAQKAWTALVSSVKGAHIETAYAQGPEFCHTPLHTHNNISYRKMCTNTHMHNV